MGAPKQKWTAEEEAALKAGISKHGTGKWRTILKDPEFSSILRYRSNVDLKDKWRNMNVTVNASGSREKVRATPTPAFKKLRSAPKQESTSASAAAIMPVASDGDDEMPEAAPIAAISAPGKSLSRLENIILEAVKTLNEPTGSYKMAVANYIEEQYWPPADFDHVLSAKLNELTSSGKLIKEKNSDDAEELLAKIGRNHDDWSTPEPTPTPIVKKRGMIKLNDEDMREAKKSLKEKGIKPEDVKNLPPIEDLCEITPPSSMIEKRKMKKFKFGELFKKGTTSTGRPSRASTQIRRSYNEDVIAPSFAPEEDNGAPNASSFPCYDFLTNAGILDDFFTLVNRAGLATYVGDEREQYYMLTKIFVESFKFHNTQYEPTVAFKIYDIPVTMELEEFCRALDIAL
ncbi:hypothetical protein QYE76_059562 [Lolium multiflorum]|uniref:MYB transcription factor n=1 Tax=Lolium multiflorum TaxID=4521 RepID=A0AAD8S0M0_LOLMU|nr:hypothetical protein QYE76_059562 [Lolium multiflorum]